MNFVVYVCELCWLYDFWFGDCDFCGDWCYGVLYCLLYCCVDDFFFCGGFG